MRILMRNYENADDDELTASFLFELGHGFIEDMGAGASG